VPSALQNVFASIAAVSVMPLPMPCLVAQCRLSLISRSARLRQPRFS
jgi:hypothetical protein